MSTSPDLQEVRLKGHGVSRGIGLGPITFFLEGPATSRRIVDADEVDAEIARFEAALSRCRGELQDLGSGSATPSTVAEMLEVQLLILDRSSFAQTVRDLIRKDLLSAESAVNAVAADHIRRQETVDEFRLREKALEIEDVRDRISAALFQSSLPAANIPAGAVIVAHELRPSSLIEINRSSPAGLVTERGGWTSHTSILAREFGIPMITGVRSLTERISEGEYALVDADGGEIVLNPAGETVEEYRRHQPTVTRNLDPGDGEPPTPATTLDGTPIILRVNIDIPRSYEYAHALGAAGIGLFRSESLIVNPGNIPTEDQQFEAYRELADVAGTEGVRIRTFDVGPDSLLSQLDPNLPGGSLGLRSLRLSLYEQDQFRTQLRAILRAAAVGKIALILPMVAGVAEVIRAIDILAEESARLERDGIAFGTPAIGAMIEVPSGVLTAVEIARKVDFLALGTNDLVQYLLAVDRDDESVASWYETLHPAVIRSIEQVIDAANTAGTPLIICGEMAGSPFYLPILIGLGARELSMNFQSFLQIRKLISGITLEKTRELVDIIRDIETAAEMEAFLKDFYSRHWAPLFPAGLLQSSHR